MFVDKIQVLHVFFYIYFMQLHLLDGVLISTMDYFSENGNFDFVNMSATIETSTSNRTNSDSNILIFNRVPKCASTTMEALLSKLKR